MFFILGFILCMRKLLLFNDGLIMNRLFFHFLFFSDRLMQLFFFIHEATIPLDVAIYFKFSFFYEFPEPFLRGIKISLFFSCLILLHDVIFILFRSYAIPSHLNLSFFVHFQQVFILPYVSVF